MNSKLLTAAAIALLLPIAVAQGQTDRPQSEYYRVHPLSGQPTLGRLAEITKDKVTLVVSSANREFPVNEIKFVQPASEPRELTDARNLALDGHYDQILATLDKIPPPQLANEVIRQEVDYYRALAAARLAINHVGNASAAGTALVTFISANKNSYHFYEANETAGDLLVSMGRFDQAPRYYTELASAPWPEYKMRAAAALGRVMQAQGKHQEAIQQFDAALGLEARSKAAEMQSLPLKIRKGKSLAELGRSQEALKVLTELIEQAQPEQNQNLAEAYNALGATYVKLGQPKDALYAYLHVDLLFKQLPDQHAEALYHLKELWKQLNQSERAKEAAAQLKSRYAASPWNK